MKRRQFFTLTEKGMSIKARCKKAAMLVAVLVLPFTACTKDESSAPQPQPEQGKVTLTTDWSDRTEGVDVPTSYNVSLGDYTGTATETVYGIDHQFQPGSYRLVVYNTATNIAVSGTTATVASATGDGAGSFINSMPGCLFTNVQEVTIEKGGDHAVTARMKQQVRRLTLVIEPTGDAAPRIESMEGRLSCVAGSLDFADDTHGTPSDVELHFTKLTEGADAGKWTATAWLLGTAGTGQKLTARLRFVDDNPLATTLESDLTTALAGFNGDKARPLSITGKLTDTPSEGGFTASIEDWETANGGDTGAH
ncbi:MAG: FimB/Mfa2 family fimbrial subunit [Oscillospiraceae bacterium]|nr:FimB/Mfa2 family fimbrial subunit [Oscillospiraceae bacterium]